MSLGSAMIAKGLPASPTTADLYGGTYPYTALHAGEAAARAKIHSAPSPLANSAFEVMDRTRRDREKVEKALEILNSVVSRTARRAAADAGTVLPSVAKAIDMGAAFKAARSTVGVASPRGRTIPLDTYFPAPSDPPFIDTTYPETEVEEAPVDEAVDELVAGSHGAAEAWLAEVCPGAKVELGAARERITDAAAFTGAERAAFLAQGLNSVRRALSKTADQVYPPRPGEVKDASGQLRKVDENAYINRLILAIEDATSRSSNERTLERSEVELFSKRLRSLVDRVAKGVHTDGALDESNELYVDAWRIIGSLRRLLARP